MASRQQGITLMSFVVVLIVVGFFAVIAMKLFPMYSEFYNLRGVMNEYAEQPNSASIAPAQMYTQMDQRFNIAYIQSVESRKHMKIIRAPGGRTSQLVVSYEVRKELMFNLDIVGKFDYAVDLNGASSSG